MRENSGDGNGTKLAHLRLYTNSLVIRNGFSIPLFNVINGACLVWDAEERVRAKKELFPIFFRIF